MAFEFDKLAQLKCDHCGGMIDPDEVPADPPVNISCPHCQQVTNVPGKLGTLQVTEVIGKGAAGTVYKALDTTLHRWVAVKLLHPGEGDNKKIVEATVAEARALAALNHANVVHVHNIGMRNGQPFIVMELLLGSGKLNVMLKEGWTADEQRGLEIGVDIAQALKASWNAGLLHRDVKPGNILFNDEGVAKLLDFSVVVDDGSDEKVVIGTPYYISPEAAKAEDVDFRSDLYSLGATLFHLMTGSPPFAGETQRDILRARLKTSAPDIRSLNPSISGQTAAVIARLLQRDPENRYASHDDLLYDLREAQAAFAMMPATPSETDELAAISSAATDSATPHATPRERVSRTVQPAQSGNQKMVIGGIAAAVLIVVGIVIAIVASSGNDTDKPDIADGTPNRDRNIFDDSSVKDRSSGSKDQLASNTKDHTKHGASRDGSAKNVTPSPLDSKDLNTSKDGATKNPNKDSNNNNTPRPKSPQEIFEEQLTAWDKQTKTVLQQIAAQSQSPWTAGNTVGAFSKQGATVRVNEDGVVEVSGGNPDTDEYVITIPLPQTTAEQIKAIRLESILDPAAPAKGAGRSASGNFVLTGIEARVADQSGERALVLADASASYSQEQNPVTDSLDGNNQTGWAIFERRLAPNEAIFRVASVTNPAAPAQAPDLEFESFETEQLDAERWTVEGNAFNKGTAAATDVSDARNLRSAIVGKRYLDARKGVNGDKKKRLDATGKLRSAPFVVRNQAIRFKIAGVGKAQIRLLVDGEPVRTMPVPGNRGNRSFVSTGWDVRELLGRFAEIEIIDPKSAYIALDDLRFSDDLTGIESAAPPKRRLVVTLKHLSEHKQHTLGHFRVSYTTVENVAIEPSLPLAVKTALLNPARSRNDAAAIIAFYKKHVDGDEPYLPPLPKPVVKQTPPPDTSTKPTVPKDNENGFAVVIVSPGDKSIKDEASAMAVLEGRKPAQDVSRLFVPVINFADGTRSVGMFRKDVPFTEGDGKKVFADHFAARMAGRVVIPEAGKWTFFLAADDHARLSLNGRAAPAAATQRVARILTVDFPQAGAIDLQVDFAEFGGQGYVELAAVKGGVPTDRSKFVLVGDTANGGLKVLRPTAPLLPRLVATPPSPPKDKTIQSPGDTPPAISRGVVWIDPQDSKNKNYYRHFAINDADARILIPRFAKWHYWSDAKHPTGTWTASDYNAGGWSTGEAVFSIGRLSFAKTILDSMHDRNTAFYMRTPFEIDNLERIDNLNLLVRTFDPCVIYLNGKEASRSPGLEGSGAEAKDKGVSAITGVQQFDLTKALPQLQKGKNWIAIEWHNLPNASDRRFMVDPILVAKQKRLLSEGKKNAKPLGWAMHETNSYKFDDVWLLIPQKGKNNARIARSKLSIDIKRREVYFILMVRVDGEAEGKFRFKGRGKENGSNKGFVIEGESRSKLEPGRWQPHVINIDTAGKQGKLESVEIFLPKDAKDMEIKWIGYTATGQINLKRPTPGQFWNFGKKEK